MRIVGVFASSLLKKITDTFTRANTTTGLGTSTSGSLWSALRGNWIISSNKATSSDAPSSYPLTSVEVGKLEQTIKVTDIGSGPGIAFWVTDANNWWGAYQNQVTTYYAGNYYAGEPSSFYAGSSYAGEPSSYYAGNYFPPSYYGPRDYYFPGSYAPPIYYAGIPASSTPPSYYAGIPSSYTPPSTTYAYTLYLIRAMTEDKND